MRSCLSSDRPSDVRSTRSSARVSLPATGTVGQQRGSPTWFPSRLRLRLRLRLRVGMEPRGTATARLNTDVTTLDLSTVAGSVYVRELDGVILDTAGTAQVPAQAPCLS